MSLRCRTIPSPTFSSPSLRHFTGFRIFRPTMTDLRSFRVTADAAVSGNIWSGSCGRVEREYFIMKRRGLCVYGVGEDDLTVVEREGDPTVEEKEGDPTIVVERENGWTVAEEERKGDRRVVEEREGDRAVVVEREYDRRVVEEREDDRRRGEVLVAASVTVVLGVANRVLYKLALVPLKHYPFFLAQLATFGYVLVYFSILYIRYRSGIVTEDMLSLPKGPYVVVGLLEALGAASGMAAGAILSGAAIPILSQSFLVWQILFSYIFLGRSYRFNQLFGCFMVALGVIITVASGSGAGSLMEAGVFWSLLMIVSFAFQAADTVLKEIIFLDSFRQLKGGTVDLFVINSYGSAFQALFICLLLPFLSKLWGIPFNQLPNYLRAGAGCFMNNGSISGCEGAPLLPLLFVIVNMGFNISLLYLLKISSAVVSCLASTVSVPISVLLFTLPLPYLGVASSLPSGFVAGAMVLFLGMLIYSWSPTSSSTAPKQSVN